MTHNPEYRVDEDDNVTNAGGPDGSSRRTDPESPKVAFFVQNLRYGGAQKVTINIANGLTSRGYDVDLVTANFEGDFVSDISSDLHVVDLDVPSVAGLGVLAGIPRLKSYLESAQPDVLIGAQTHANIAAVLAARVAKVSLHVTLTEHSAFGRSEGFKDWLTNTLASSVYTLADEVVGVSGGVVESIVENTRVDSAATSVLYNPIDLESVRARSKEPVDDKWITDPDIRPVVSVSRLESQKNLSLLLRAFETVNERHPDTRLIIVGKGSERRRLSELARSLDIEDVVSFPGYVDNPYGYMRQSAVFVLSSRYEGLPTVLIEALACGCSIVSTDCPYGPREILADGEYGQLVPVDDDLALADAIGATLESPADPQKIIKRSEDFSMSNGIDRYEAYILDNSGKLSADERTV
jgi:glycosyltransferase involved in cell wall biosynthesis